MWKDECVRSHWAKWCPEVVRGNEGRETRQKKRALR